MEQWRDIPGYEGRYQVSDQGRVKSVPHRVRLVVHGVETTRLSPGRMLKPGRCRSGHLSVALGKGNSKMVHGLVLTAFVGARPEAQEALHLNHTPSDNRLCNLRWGTRSENVAMDYAVGTRGAEDAHPQAKITRQHIPAILDLRARGLTQAEIGLRVGVSDSVICNILQGKHWTTAR